MKQHLRKQIYYRFDISKSIKENCLFEMKFKNVLRNFFHIFEKEFSSFFFNIVEVKIFQIKSMGVTVNEIGLHM